MSGKLCPIIEPVSVNTITKGAFSTFVGHGMRFILITNPAHGVLAEKEHVQLYKDILEPELLEYDNYAPALVVDAATTARELESFMKRYEKLYLAIVYQGEPEDVKAGNLLRTSDRFYHHVFIAGRTPKDFQKEFNRHRRIEINDPFNRQARNVDYPPLEFFTDRNTKAGNSEGIGWGDFSIVGDHFAEGGGAAHSVAIHHIHHQAHKGDNLYVHHFVEPGDTTADREGKGIRAMMNFVNEMGGLIPDDTEACQEWRELATAQVFKGLGYLKKLSLKHHFEVILQHA